MIIRDATNIIVQRSWWTTPDQIPDDAGDSLRSTGIMAWCGSEIDSRLLPDFMLMDGRVVRHPIDKKWSNPELTSRDQVDCFVAGLHAINRPDLCRKVLKAYGKRFFFINKDIFWFDSLGALVLSCRFNYGHYLFSLLFAPIFIISVFWHCWFVPFNEQNQVISRLTVAGKFYLWLYTKMHPGYEEVLEEYWGPAYPYFMCKGGPWRCMLEVKHAMVTKIRALLS